MKERLVCFVKDVRHVVFSVTSVRGFYILYVYIVGILMGIIM